MKRMYKTYKTISNINPIVFIGGLIVFIFFTFWFIKNVVTKILWAAAPILFVGSLIMNHRVFIGYVKWLYQLIKNNTLYGLLATILSIFGFPYVCVYLFIRSYQMNRFKGDGSLAREGDYIKYEEVEDFLDISDAKKAQEDLDSKFGDI